MPISQDGVGYSQYTPQKLQHLRAILEMHISITMAVLKKHPYYKQEYHYIDATAGPGDVSALLANYVPAGQQIKGSPLLFLATAEDQGLQYRADFVDKERANIESLQQHLPALKHGTATLHCRKYATVIRNLIRVKDNNQLGLLFVDETTGIPDFPAVAYVSEMRPRMEVLMYLSATSLKRQYHVTEQLLSDYLSAIGKAYWLVREPIHGDPHQWAFLLGSSTDLFKDYKSKKFYRLDSPEGQSFFGKLNLSSRQMQEKLQPKLFDE